MARSERQDAFDWTEPGAAVAAGGGRLRLVAAPGRPLSKAQKKFDRLLRKVETLREERGRLAARWERFVKLYQERIHPEERRMLERRRQVAKLLAAQWRKPKGLGKRQREQLRALLVGQLQALIDAAPDLLDEDLRALCDELRPAAAQAPGPAGEDGRAANEDDVDAAGPADAPREATGKAGGEAGAGLPPDLVEMIRELGLDPSRFREDMNEDEFSREVEAQMAEARLRGGRGKGSAARRDAAELRAAERAAAREEARKRTVAVIYKQLAKALHPDLEQDPALRARKQALMQELTKAHREGDLHTLLRLELEWLKREDGDLERLSDEKLKIYTELLEEQVAALQNEVREVPFEPRFSSVARYARPFASEPQDVESVLISIRRLSESLKSFRDELSGPRSREALREALQEVASQQRMAERWENFMGGF